MNYNYSMKFLSETTCPKCKGKKLILKEDNTVELCECVKNSKESILRAMNIPKRYWSIAKNLENFDEFEDMNKQNKSYTNAYISILSYVEDFKNNEGNGLILIGPPGVGKTYLSIFCLLYIESKYKIRGLFYDTRSLVLDLKMLIGKDRISDSEEYNKLLHKIIDTPLLILDDLGNETLTDYNKDIITYIISSRYNNLKPIILTTNLEIENFITNKSQKNILNTKTHTFGFEQMPKELREDLSCRLGLNIVSRIAEMCNIIYIKGEDKRLKKRYEK